jgi:hypothetical protein
MFGGRVFQQTVGKIEDIFVCLRAFKATFNNISIISWRCVLLVEETGGPGENHRPVLSCLPLLKLVDNNSFRMNE